jgi:lipopolysaccharide export system protein LptA
MFNPNEAPKNPLRAAVFPRAWLLALALGLASPFAAALPSDQQQPIHITSDSAVQENNTVTYRGHVVIVQGSLHIEADQVVVYHQGGKLQRVVATGAPVRFREQPEVNGSLITGNASTLIYYHTEQRIELLQDALVDRDRSTVKGNRIEYLLPSKTVRAEGNAENHDRVEMVLQPGQVESPAPPAQPAPAPAQPAKPAQPAGGEQAAPQPAAPQSDTTPSGNH